MLLTIDIGNTNITMGVFEEEFLLGMFRMTTKRARTSDEYGFTICGILEHRGIDSKQIDSVIVASVVPDIMHSFTSGIIKYLGTEPMIVSSQTDTGVRVVTENPTRTGPDRIVNAAENCPTDDWRKTEFAKNWNSGRIKRSRSRNAVKQWKRIDGF